MPSSKVEIDGRLSVGYILGDCMELLAREPRRSDAGGLKEIGGTLYEPEGNVGLVWRDPSGGVLNALSSISVLPEEVVVGRALAPSGECGGL